MKKRSDPCRTFRRSVPSPTLARNDFGSNDCAMSFATTRRPCRGLTTLSRILQNTPDPSAPDAVNKHVRIPLGLAQEQPIVHLTASWYTAFNQSSQHSLPHSSFRLNVSAATSRNFWASEGFSIRSAASRRPYEVEKVFQGVWPTAGYRTARRAWQSRPVPLLPTAIMFSCRSTYSERASSITSAARRGTWRAREGRRRAEVQHHAEDGGEMGRALKQGRRGWFARPLLKLKTSVLGQLNSPGHLRCGRGFAPTALHGKQIARELGISPATVSRILRRRGLNRLSALEPAEPIRRYAREKAVAGEHDLARPTPQTPPSTMAMMGAGNSSIARTR